MHRKKLFLASAISFSIHRLQILSYPMPPRSLTAPMWTICGAWFNVLVCTRTWANVFACTRRVPSSLPTNTRSTLAHLRRLELPTYPQGHILSRQSDRFLRPLIRFTCFFLLFLSPRRYDVLPRTPHHSRRRSLDASGWRRGTRQRRSRGGVDRLIWYRRRYKVAGITYWSGGRSKRFHGFSVDTWIGFFPFAVSPSELWWMSVFSSPVVLQALAPLDQRVPLVRDCSSMHVRVATAFGKKRESVRPPRLPSRVASR